MKHLLIGSLASALVLMFTATAFADTSLVGSEQNCSSAKQRVVFNFSNAIAVTAPDNTNAGQLELKYADDELVVGVACAPLAGSTPTGSTNGTEGALVFDVHANTEEVTLAVGVTDLFKADIFNANYFFTFDPRCVKLFTPDNGATNEATGKQFAILNFGTCPVDNTFTALSGSKLPLHWSDDVEMTSVTAGTFSHPVAIEGLRWTSDNFELPAGIYSGYVVLRAETSGVASVDPK